MAHTIDISRKIMNVLRRDDGSDTGKGLALLLHEDKIETTIETVDSDTLPGITLHVFSEILPYFRGPRVDITTYFMEYNILLQRVDLASLFNMIQLADYFKDTGNSKYLMDLTCNALINKVEKKTFREIREGFNTEQEFRCIFERLQFRLYENCCTQRHADNILRQREKETFTKNAILEDLRLSRFVSTWLSFVDRREKRCSDYLQELMVCTDFERLLQIINSLSILVSEDRKAADLVDSDTAKYVLEIARFCEYEQDDIQCQAVYILSCVSFDKCYDVMTNDVIPVLVELMSHSFYHLAIAAVIGLTRLANTSPGCIKLILDKGGLEAALNTAKECRNRQKIICCLARFLAVVCRSYDLPPDKVKVAVTLSEEFFQSDLTSDYHKVHACHTLQYLTYGKVVEIGEKLFHKLVALIYKFLSMEDFLIASSALGVVGNIARWGNPNTIQVLTSSSVLLHCLRDIMVWCKFKKFWMEACQIISNIAARSTTFTNDMDTEIELIGSLCRLLEKGDSNVQREAAWAICNCIYGKKERLIINF